MLSWILYFILIILNAIDVVSTRLLLASGVKEANPVMAWFVEKLGRTLGLCAPKLFWMVCLFFLVRNYGSYALLTIVLVLMTAFYAVIVYRNIHLMEVF